MKDYSLYLVKNEKNILELLLKISKTENNELMEFYYEINAKTDKDGNIINLDIKELLEPMKYIISKFDIESPTFYNKFENIKLSDKSCNFILNKVIEKVKTFNKDENKKYDEILNLKKN